MNKVNIYYNELKDIKEYLKNNEELKDVKELYKKVFELFDYAKENINYYFYNKYKYIYEDTKENKERLYQDRFRNGLIKKYGSCIITDRPIDVCEACHIIPHKDNVNYDIDNGLLLSADLHKLFDKDLLKINPDTLCIEFTDNVMENIKYKDYHQYNNMKLNLNDKTKEYLAEKYQKKINIDIVF